MKEVLIRVLVSLIPQKASNKLLFLSFNKAHIAETIYGRTESQRNLWFVFESIRDNTDGAAISYSNFFPFFLYCNKSIPSNRCQTHDLLAVNESLRVRLLSGTLVGDFFFVPRLQN